jgi:hypothetical protein
MLQLHIVCYVRTYLHGSFVIILPSNRKLNIISAFFKNCASTHSLLAGEVENDPCLLLKSNKKVCCCLIL